MYFLYLIFLSIKNLNLFFYLREPKKKEKTEDEIIEEKEKKIEDLKGKISVLNFDI